ncbi:uncharacterized protein PITG_23223 [Phytophthora infestans T30-4]|uniref:Secreted RxLR effector peptide protein n=1 Tax=Phytophthora infestans (strain T30-4) TaxID=403677 RepID=D0RLW5_PHYIT|nr:uncharacterized protein PITG_23223 [Phytophthora infestans T30-4]EEY54575.1 conserved hypothetical protein [Phytophthora infestans T30-4]|eukprot:XP_002909965.1 conserved hypothetical protein [Phytophthora infestans T30-4]
MPLRRMNSGVLLAITGSHSLLWGGTAPGPLKASASQQSPRCGKFLRLRKRLRSASPASGVGSVVKCFFRNKRMDPTRGSLSRISDNFK